MNTRDHFADFFDKFEEACSIVYTRREDKEVSFRKRL